MKDTLTALKAKDASWKWTAQEVLDGVSGRLGRTTEQMMPIMNEFKAQYKRTAEAMLYPHLEVPRVFSDVCREVPWLSIPWDMQRTIKVLCEEVELGHHTSLGSDSGA